MTLNFNQLRSSKQVSAEDYFIDFNFECQHLLQDVDNRISSIADQCGHIIYLI